MGLYKFLIKDKTMLKEDNFSDIDRFYEAVQSARNNATTVQVQCKDRLSLSRVLDILTRVPFNVLDVANKRIPKYGYHRYIVKIILE